MRIKTALVSLLLVCSLLGFKGAYAETLPSDAYITSDVKIKLNNESFLSGNPITVYTFKGLVSLRGNVNSDEDAAKVVELTQACPGVKDIDTSNLTVNGKKQLNSDAIITARIRGLFIQQKLFTESNLDDLTIETQNGVVTLTGTVEDQVITNNAIVLVKSIPGVKAVKTNIKISLFRSSTFNQSKLY
jgi:hyperosmotically inducible protein